MGSDATGLARRIKSERERLRMTQAEVGAILRVDSESVSRWERGGNMRLQNRAKVEEWLKGGLRRGESMSETGAEYIAGEIAARGRVVNKKMFVAGLLMVMRSLGVIFDERGEGE